MRINLRAGAQLSDRFRKLNPQVGVPSLQFDDGTLLTETMAIGCYLAAPQPSPGLFGRYGTGQRLYRAWPWRAEFAGLLPATNALRNGEPRFAKQVVRPHAFAPIPPRVERGKAPSDDLSRAPDEPVHGREFVATDHFSAADISAYIAIEFAAWVAMSGGAKWCDQSRWVEATRARPSVWALA